MAAKKKAAPKKAAKKQAKPTTPAGTKEFDVVLRSTSTIRTTVVAANAKEAKHIAETSNPGYAVE